MSVWSPTWIFKGIFFFAVVLLSLFTAVFPPHITGWQHTLKMEISYYQRPPCLVHPMCCLSSQLWATDAEVQRESSYIAFSFRLNAVTHTPLTDPLFCLSITGTTVHKKPPPARLSRCQSSSSAKINNIRQKGRKKANKKIKINNMSKEINKASKLHRWWLEGGLISCLSPSISHPSFNVCLTQ